MADENIVRLKIISRTRTPEEITESIGLKCDKSWRIGEKRNKTTIIEKNNGWILSSGLPRAASLDSHIEKLFGFLAPRRNEIQALSHSNDVEFSIVIYGATPPALNFSKGVIDFLGQIGASLDVDLYLTGDEAD